MTQNETATCHQIDPHLTRDSSGNVPAGVVYFVRSGDSIKIGSASDFKRRSSSLQTASPEPLNVLAIVPGLDEYKIHQRFAHLRIRGEWFRAEPELLEFIQLVKVETPPVEKEITEKGPRGDLKRSLKKLADRYESADDYSRPAIEYTLRKVYASVNAEQRTTGE